MGYGLDVTDVKFERVTVLNQPMLFTCCRVDRDTVPESLHIYEVRHDDENYGDPVQIGRWIRVNFWGTLISSSPILLEPSTVIDNAYRDIDPNKDWSYKGFSMGIQDYLKLAPPKRQTVQER